jgi:hypothetical protein
MAWGAAAKKDGEAKGLTERHHLRYVIVRGSVHITKLPSSFSCMARWLIATFGDAPCQCFSLEQTTRHHRAESLLSETLALSQAESRTMPKRRPQRCNARRRRSDAALHRVEREGRLMEYLRSSSRCRNWPVRGKKRCRLHGGFSTGPRTPEGKARTIAAMVEGRRRLLEKLKPKESRCPGATRGAA